MTLNRYYLPNKLNSRLELLKRNIKCIFISYQQKDKEEAIKIADYFLELGIQVYFDRYDSDLKMHHQSNNAKAVTDAIKNGINNSSHMLVIVSPNTLGSTWVPFEAGYGYDRTELLILCLKGIPKGTLPEYLKATKIVRDLYDLNIFIQHITGKTNTQLTESKSYSQYDSQANSLSSIMDSLIVEN